MSPPDKQEPSRDPKRSSKERFSPKPPRTKKPGAPPSETEPIERRDGRWIT